MFRAILCSSSGGSTVYTQHLVLYVSLCKQLSDSVKVYTVDPPDDEQQYGLKNIEEYEKI